MEGDTCFMSSIDQRIVQMQFDNKQFENNVQTSVKSLDNLKQGLNLSESAKNLTNLDKVAQSFSLEGIAAGVENIQNKFSTLGIIGITAIQNITNSALAMGKQFMSAFTIDPVKTGLDEYEKKINSIQVIMSNTGGKNSMSEVVDILDDLNTYSDQTIYNFSEMTRNIGTFTAAGIGLKESAADIKGIANLAAASGSNSEQASTAMYQLSQAMASGTVKLMDWNSVVNAGMGGQLFQNALKTTAKAMGKNVDESISFRDSLEKGWLTADVLSATLSKFASDESMLKAATQVKTFSQLLDTLKESAQSGWGKTWEILIGNFDEAASLLTNVNNVLSGYLSASADARNSMLQDWKDLGGRDSAIQAVSNAFQGLLSIAKPVKEAFREIFPATTGKQLADFTKSLADLTAKFKIGDDTALQLKNTFKGLFAILDMAKQAITAVVTAILPLGSSFGTAGGGILKVTSAIGEFFVGLDNAANRTEFFKNAIKNMSDILTGGFSNAIDANKTKMSKFSDSLDELKAKLKPLTDALDTAREAISKCFDGFIAGIKSGDAASGFISVLLSIGTVMVKIASWIVKAGGEIGKAIAGAFQAGDLEKGFDVLNGGIFAAILLGIKKFVDSLSGPVSGFTGILDGVKGSLEAFQASLKAGVLLKIAIAIGILAASLMVLAMIDPERLNSALLAITVLFTELFAAMLAFEKFSKGGAGSITKVATGMILLSTAVLILASAMSKIAELDWDGIAKGLVGVGVLMAELVVTSLILSKNQSSMVKGSIGVILFAEAIKILATAVKVFADMSIEQLTKGLVSVGVLLTELSLFMKTTDFDGMGVSKGLGILALAAGISVLADAVKKFSEIDNGNLVKGLGAVGIALTEISLFTNLTGNASKVISTAVALTIIAGAMLILAQAIGIMGNMSLEEIGKGLLTMGASLAIIAVALKALPKSTILIGAGLVVVATSLVILSEALGTMGNMSWEEIAKGLVVLAGALTIIAVAMQFMTGAIPGAVALITVAGALAILCPVLLALGSMSWESIAQGLTMLAGTFAVIGVAGLLLGPLTPVLLALAGVVILIGVAVLATGAGMMMLAGAITVLSVAIPIFAAALSISAAELVAGFTIILTGIASLIPLIITQIGVGLVAFAVAIGNGAPAIASVAVSVILAFLQALNDTIPQIVNTVLSLLATILETVVKYLPRFIQAGIDIIMALLDGIASCIEAIVQKGIEIMINFIKGITSMLGEIVDAGVKLMISFINGLADGIRNNTDEMIAAVSNLMSAILEAGFKVLTAGFDGFVDVGKNLMRGLINGLKNGVAAIGDTVSSIGNSVLNGFKNIFGIHSPSTETTDMGMYLDKGLGGGMSKYSSLVDRAAKGVGESALDSMSGALSGVSDILSGNVAIDPTVRPVLDLTNIQNGAGQINSMLSNQQAVLTGVEVANSASNNNAETVAEAIIRANTTNEQRVVTAVTKLSDLMSDLKDVMSKQQIVMDTGAVVGSIITEVDAALGQISTLKGRNN